VGFHSIFELFLVSVMESSIQGLIARVKGFKVLRFLRINVSSNQVFWVLWFQDCKVSGFSVSELLLLGIKVSGLRD
jgi:hypothetical protein